MNITGTQIAYFHTCRRKLWLASHHIGLEHTSDTVADGRLIGESSYERRNERFVQIEIEGSKIDFYDPHNGVVHETKRSDKMEPAHIAQLKYYLYLLHENCVKVSHGILEYPKQRQTVRVDLTPKDIADINQWIVDIKKIIDNPVCPPTINKPYCKNCAYHDFCYVDENINS
jgi:CRISPR-associated exonuclease Cas4